MKSSPQTADHQGRAWLRLGLAAIGGLGGRFVAIRLDELGASSHRGIDSAGWGLVPIELSGEWRELGWHGEVG